MSTYSNCVSSRVDLLHYILCFIACMHGTLALHHMGYLYWVHFHMSHVYGCLKSNVYWKWLFYILWSYHHVYWYTRCPTFHHLFHHMCTDTGCTTISSHVYWYWVHHYFITCVLILGAPLFHHMCTDTGCTTISSHVYWYWVHHYFITCILILGAPLFHHMYTGAGCSFISTQMYWYWCLLTSTHVVLAPHFIHVSKLAQGVPSFHYRCSSTGTVLLHYIHHNCTDTVCTCVLVLVEATFCHMSTDTGCSLVHNMCNIFFHFYPRCCT